VDLIASVQVENDFLKSLIQEVREKLKFNIELPADQTSVWHSVEGQELFHLISEMHREVSTAREQLCDKVNTEQSLRQEIEHSSMTE